MSNDAAYVIGRAAHVGPGGSDEWSLSLPCGFSGDEELEKEWLRIAAEIFNLFVAKQHDYGPTNISEEGIQGVLVRMSDKFKRLRNLLGKAEPSVASEALTDTMRDLADYAIILELVHKGLWPQSETTPTECGACGRPLT